MRSAIATIILGFATGLAACHSEPENVPLSDQKIYFSDKFFDVKAFSPDRALIVGYGGKILETTDGGATFNKIESGTDLALYRVVARGQKVWISGQEGLMLHSEDAGKTWQKQNSDTKTYLFSVFFTTDEHGYAVGDKSVITETADGGKTWKARKIELPTEGQSDDMALAMQDPIFYDIRFTSEQNGWIAGEFGQLLHTTDAGQSWTPHQNTLMTPQSGITEAMSLPTFFGEYLIDEKNAIATGLDGRIARTRDGGTTWRFEKMKLTFPISDPLYQPTVTPDGHAWAVGAAGEVVHLPPGQTEWTRAELGMPVYTWLRSVDFADAQNGWLVGGYGYILRTSDGGKSWHQCLG